MELWVGGMGIPRSPQVLQARQHRSGVNRMPHAMARSSPAASHGENGEAYVRRKHRSRCAWHLKGTHRTGALSSRPTGPSSACAPSHGDAPTDLVRPPASSGCSDTFPNTPVPAPTSLSPSAGAAPGLDTEAVRRGLASMAQLATAWAQVSSRLAPGTQLAPADSVAAAAAMVHQPAGTAAPRVAATVPLPAQQSGRQGGGVPANGGSDVGAGAAAPSSSSVGVSIASASRAEPPAQSGWQRALVYGGQGPPQPSSSQHQHQQGQQQDQQQQTQQQQQQHFEAIIIALKLALASLHSAPPRRDTRSPATRAVQLASTLAELCAAGLPLDAFAMCAGVVAEAADMGALRHDVIRAQLGPSVAALVHDMLRVRQAPRRIELLDDEGAGAVREWCLAFHDVRACVVEVVNCWDELQHMGAMPAFDQQALALEALQIWAPLGHALGLGSLSSLMEDACLKVLFPDSYASTSAWLRGLMDPAEDALFAAQQRLLAALDAHPGFGRVSSGLVVKARTKSLFSVMKKLLHLGDLARGGRSREELYDLLGMRAIVQPPDFLPPDEAEAAATKACYIVQDVASTLWRPIPTRSKDYIVAPKPNGYQSIHLTLQLGQLDVVAAAAGVAQEPAAAAGSSGGAPGQDQEQHPGSGTGSGSSASSWSSSSFDGGMVAELHTTASSASSSATRNRDDGGAAAAAVSSHDAAQALEEAEAAVGGGPLCLELQIRTAAMDRAAESGDAAHAVYKGGLDARTARQLQAWTHELRTRLSAQPRGRLLLRAASTASLSPEEARAAAERKRRRRERRAAAAAAAAASATAMSPAGAAGGAAAAALAAVGVSSTSSRGDPSSQGEHGCSTSGFERGQGAQPAKAAAAAASLNPRPLWPQATALSASSASAFVPSSKPMPIESQGIANGGGFAGSAAAGLHRPLGHTSSVSTTTSPRSNSPSLSTSTSSKGHIGGSTGAAASGKGLLLPRPVRPVTGGPQSAGGPAAAGAGAAAGESRGPGLAPAYPRTTTTTTATTTTTTTTSTAAAGPQTESFTSTTGTHTGPPATPAAEPGAAAGLGREGCGASAGVGPSAQVSQEHQQQPMDLGHQQQKQQQGQPQQQQQQERQGAQPEAQSPGQQLVMLFSSLGSVDDVDEAPLEIGLAHRDAAAAAEQLFRHLDVNGDGRLSLGEVRQVLLDLAAPSSESDAAALVAALDGDGDGGVSMEEFVEGVSRAQLQQQQQQQLQQTERERERKWELEELARQEAQRRAAAQHQKWQPWQHRW